MGGLVHHTDARIHNLSLLLFSGLGIGSSRLSVYGEKAASISSLAIVIAVITMRCDDN